MLMHCFIRINLKNTMRIAISDFKPIIIFCTV